MAFDMTGLGDVIETIMKAALGPVMARVKALEARPTEPGPPGPPGADGLGFDAYTVEYDGERTFTHRWRAGEKTAEISFVIPMPIYRGVFLHEKVYQRGDMVTVNGSVYHCDEDTTTRPGEGAKAWTLAVKRGKDDRGTWPRS